MQTTAPRPQNPSGLTRSNATPRAAGFARASATADHGAPVTAAPPRRRRKYTPRARRCAVCKAVFHPTNKTAKTCSEACRSKLYRRRQAAQRRRQPAPPRPLIAATCAHCRRGFFTSNPLQTHCSASCRTLASRARRKAAIALLIYAGYTAQDAGDAIDLHGLATIHAQLKAVGYSYDPADRTYRSIAPPPTVQ